jgi:hypothetical protein
MKDCYLDGAAKVKTLMGKQMYYCRSCGMSYKRKTTAERCCAKTKLPYIKAKAEFQEKYNAITGGSK